MEKKQNQIIVGMDFSESAINALPLAFEFSKIHNAELVLLSVIGTSSSIAQWFGGGGSTEKQGADVEEKMKEIVDKFEGQGTRLKPLIKEGSPVNVILETAEELDAELILVGTHGWTSEKPTSAQGTIGMKLIRSAPCPVVTVKGIREDHKMKKMLIPVDKDFGIREIRRFLKDMENKFEDRIELLSVVSPSLSPEDSDYKSWKSHLVKQQRALASIGFVNTESIIIQNSNPSKAIIEYAESHANEIDLILMETHGRSGVVRMVSGSVTEAVINHTRLPVFSIRPEREEKGTSYGPSGY